MVITLKLQEDIILVEIKDKTILTIENGVVERSHKIDNEQFYSKKRFKSEKEMFKEFKRNSVRTNNTARRILGFKTPNEMVEEYFKNLA